METSKDFNTADIHFSKFSTSKINAFEKNLYTSESLEPITPVAETIAQWDEVFTPIAETLALYQQTLYPVFETLALYQQTLYPVFETLALYQQAISPVFETLALYQQAISPVFETLALYQQAISPVFETLALYQQAISPVFETIALWNKVFAPITKIETIKNYIYNIFIRELELDYKEFWEKYYNNLSNIFNEKELKSNLRAKIETNFFKNVLLTKQFDNLLKDDYNYKNYFNWFKRYYLYYTLDDFIKDLNVIEVKCLIEPDIEVSDEYYIKIVITVSLRNEDYRLMLKLMRDFIKKQEIHIKNIKKHQSKIFDCFKKTYFIFKTIDE